MPRPQGLAGKAYLLRLKLEDAAGRVVSRNSYWLSTQEDVLDWKKAQWYYTPTKRHGDLKALSSLPATTLALASRVVEQGTEGAASIELRNEGKTLAFQVRVKVVDKATGEEVLPVYFDDNYFELLPGETRTLHAAFPLDRPALGPGGRGRGLERRRRPPLTCRGCHEDAGHSKSPERVGAT